MSILLVTTIDESSSLWNISRENFISGLRIIVVSCETCRWATVLVMFWYTCREV